MKRTMKHFPALFLTKLALFALLAGCGVEPAQEGEAGPRLIIGGGEVAATAYPSVVLFASQPRGTALCSATLLSPRCALTANHCGYTSLYLQEKAGEVYRKRPHEKADLLLVKTVEALDALGGTPFPAVSDVIPAVEVKAGALVDFVGFGDTGRSDYDPTKKIKRGVKAASVLRVFDEKVLPTNPFLHDQRLLSSASGETGVCFGDSGGPAFRNGSSKEIVGVAHRLEVARAAVSCIAWVTVGKSKYDRPCSSKFDAESTDNQFVSGGNKSPDGDDSCVDLRQSKTIGKETKSRHLAWHVPTSAQLAPLGNIYPQYKRHGSPYNLSYDLAKEYCESRSTASTTWTLPTAAELTTISGPRKGKKGGALVLLYRNDESFPQPELQHFWVLNPPPKAGKKITELSPAEAVNPATGKARSLSRSGHPCNQPGEQLHVSTTAYRTWILDTVKALRCEAKALKGRADDTAEIRRFRQIYLDLLIDYELPPPGTDCLVTWQQRENVVRSTGWPKLTGITKEDLETLIRAARAVIEEKTGKIPDSTDAEGIIQHLVVPATATTKEKKLLIHEIRIGSSRLRLVNHESTPVTLLPVEKKACGGYCGSGGDEDDFSEEEAAALGALALGDEGAGTGQCGIPEPTVTATPLPSPTTEPTLTPTLVPTIRTTVIPTPKPTFVPTVRSTPIPTVTPIPTNEPTMWATSVPPFFPTPSPTAVATAYPTGVPTLFPTIARTPLPTLLPTSPPVRSPTPYTTVATPAVLLPTLTFTTKVGGTGK